MLTKIMYLVSAKILVLSLVEQDKIFGFVAFSSLTSNERRILKS